ncbi:MAG: hypothetical protein KAT32_01455 [Candidatus Moranbacteria bacterium]|nr:hypothetical protein [Candidatus Moranbacteria bacterium]
MKKSLLIILLVSVSISIFYVIFLNSKSRTFKKVKELNSILLENGVVDENINWHCLSDIENKSFESSDLIKNLKKERLVDVECFNYPEGVGIAYEFEISKEKGYYFIFAEKEGRLERLRGYEQFIDCVKQKKINNNWILSEINYNCNN